MKERIIILRAHPIGCQAFVLGRTNCLSFPLFLHPSLIASKVPKLLGSFSTFAFDIVLDFIINQILSSLKPIVHQHKDHIL